MIKSNPRDMKINRLQMSSFINRTKINKKNVIKIDENSELIIKLQLLRSMSARSKWKKGTSSAKEELKEDDTISINSEISRMSFEPTRYSVD